MALFKLMEDIEMVTGNIVVSERRMGPKPSGACFFPQIMLCACIGDLDDVYGEGR